MKFKFLHFLYTLLFILILVVLQSCKPENKPGLFEHNIYKNDQKTLTTICFGSCNKQWEDQSYWLTIEKELPDLWIWMGDIIYCDTYDMDKLKGQYHLQKRHPEYLDFADSCRVIGIWDDHDYGLNDGGSDYSIKKESRDLLFDFLDIPLSDPAWNRDGAYQSYSFGPDSQLVKIILLDGRYFRDKLLPDEKSDHRYLANEKGTYLGEEQWEWLEGELTGSRASMHVFVSGVQVIPTDHYFEKWANFPNERSRFFELLSKLRVKNPVILSGDRHIGEISMTELNDQKLYEITSSGLTHSYEQAAETNPFRIGELVSVRNYGKLDLEWMPDSIKVQYSVMDLTGKVIESVESTIKK